MSEDLDEDRVRQIAETVSQLAAERAVEQALGRLGIELEEAERWRRNFQFNEDTRIGREEAGKVLRRGGLLMLLSALGWLLIEGAKQALKGDGP